MKYLLALVAASLGLGLTACGGADKGSGAASHVSVTAAQSAGAPPTTFTGASTTSQPSAGTSTGSRGTGARSQSKAGSSEGLPAPVPRHERFPHGDNSIQTFGHKAAAADTEAIASAVKRYYAAVAAGNGSGACALLSARIAHTIVASFSSAPALRGKGCGAIVQALFKVRSGQARASLAQVEVTSVRVKGDRAFALLRSKAMSAGEIPMAREGSAWKVSALIGSNLP